MGFFAALLGLSERELTDSQFEKLEKARCRMDMVNRFGCHTPPAPTQKVEYSKDAKERLEQHWDNRRDMMNSHLQHGEIDAYAYMQYVEPKFINGRNQWAIAEGKELYFAQGDPQRYAKAKIEFDKIASELIQRDLRHFYASKITDERVLRKKAERENSDAYKERLAYNDLMRKAGSRKGINSLPDYSLGERDQKPTEGKNMAGGEYNPLKAYFADEIPEDFYAQENLFATRDAKRNNVESFESATKPQDYTPDLIDGLCKALKFW